MENTHNHKLAMRLGDILTRLNQGERLDIQALAEEFRVNIRTIQRDFNERLVFLNWEEQGPRYYKLDRHQFGYLQQEEILRFANFASIANLFPQIDREFYQASLTHSIYVKGYQYEEISHLEKEFNLLKQAITNHQVIHFQYHKSGQKAAKFYQICPYRLINKNGIWYLIGTENLVMRLSEYRMSSDNRMNQPLKHVTVLEEAHNILKRTSTEQSLESSNVAGKAVEMLSNAIAEMRTYGEGFIIADQSPSAVDISAIRNTNTKIIMRLPDEEDRRLAGRSAGVTDEQLAEIAKLPKGVAVVYQNDWLEPILCQVAHFLADEKLFVEPEQVKPNVDSQFKKHLADLLFKEKLAERKRLNYTEILGIVDKIESTKWVKTLYYKALTHFL